MIIENVIAAFNVVFELETLALMVLGVAAGLITGAIPGFTITMAVVLTLPFTFGMPAVQGLATMIGVFVGGLSGGLMAGILTGIPGTPSSVATTFDAVDGSVEKLGTAVMSGETPASLQCRSPSRG